MDNLIELFNTTKPETRKISPDELLDSNSMSDVLQTGDVSKKTLMEFLDQKCISVRRGSTDIIFFLQEHTRDFELDPALQLVAGAQGTKAILVEYFQPELEANAKNFPIIGEFLSQAFNSDEQSKLRTAISSKLSELAKEKGKIIVVADIANKLEYFLDYSFIPGALMGASAICPTLLPLALMNFSMYFVNRLQQFITLGGHFDEKEIHQYEKLLFDIEDARRLFVAMGLQQVSEEYQPIGSGPCRILASYPEVHAMRIANYLIDEKSFARLSKKVKQSLYRLYPFMDASVRQYEYRNQTSQTQFQGWTRFSNRSI